MGYMRVCNSYEGLIIRVARALSDSSSALATRTIGMCGYTAVHEDRRTCLLEFFVVISGTNFFANVNPLLMSFGVGD